MMDQKMLEGQNYDCVMCGKCCQSWSVPVSPEEDKRLAAVNWSEHSLRIQGGTSAVLNGHLRSLDSRCLFLESDGKCLMQRTSGPEIKPQVCRQFPVIAVETPDGMRFSPSFVCPAVCRNLGGPFEKAIEPSLQMVKQVFKVPVCLSGQTTIEWPEYVKIENDLLAFFSRTDLTAAQKWLAVWHRSQEMARARSNQRDVKPLEETIVEVKGSDGAGEGLKARLVRGLFLVFLESVTVGKNSSGISFSFSFLVKMARLALNWGSINVFLKNKDVEIAKVDAVRFDENNPVFADILERYGRNLLFRGQIVSRQGVFRGGCFMLVIYSLMKWFSRASALLAGRTEVVSEDLEFGVGVVDQMVAQHSEGIHSLTSGGLFSLLFEMLLSRLPVASALTLL